MYVSKSHDDLAEDRLAPSLQLVIHTPFTHTDAHEPGMRVVLHEKTQRTFCNAESLSEKGRVD